MGESSRRNNVILLLGALGDALMNQGYKADIGTAITSALKVYQEAEK